MRTQWLLGMWLAIAGAGCTAIESPSLTPVAQTATHASIFLITDEAGRYGFVDQTGAVVVEPHYDYASDVVEGRAMVRQDGRWGFVDERGYEVVAPQYESANDFTEGMA